MATIVILTLAADNFAGEAYLIHPMIPRWEALGHTVLVRTERDAFAPGDLAVLHTDVTVVPEEMRALAKRYPKVINGAVLDIRKSTFSQQLVTRDGPDPGAVMVKSNWNCGGRKDFRRMILASRRGARLSALGLGGVYYALAAWQEKQRPWWLRRWLPASGYQVFAHRSEVPPGAWDNPNLVVERFRAERDGDYYCCRHWIFLGDREVSRRTWSLNPVVKAGTRLEPATEPVPEALREMRRKLGFDYGKFDYGIVNGEVLLYDVNRTPGFTRNPRKHAVTVETLFEGIGYIYDLCRLSSVSIGNYDS